MVGIFPSLDIAKLVIRVPGSRASLGPRNDSRENRSSEPQHLSAADLAADRVLLLVVMAVTAVGSRNGRRRDARNSRGELGTRTATLDRNGIQKLRDNWLYRSDN